MRLFRQLSVLLSLAAACAPELAGPDDDGLTGGDPSLPGQPGQPGDMPGPGGPGGDPYPDPGIGSGSSTSDPFGEGERGGEPIAAPAPRWKVLDFQYQVQETGYWCGPAATRVALSVRLGGGTPSQGTLASQLGTTTNGTDHIGQITGVLNQRLGAGHYVTVEMPNDPPTQAQRDRLWSDVVHSIDNRHALVANIVAPPSNHPPGYPNETIYHYFAVVGYNPDTREVYVADSANFSGQKLYWLSFDQLATLIPPKGYSTYGCPTGLTGGAIDGKFAALGRCRSVVGGPVTAELTAPDGVGRYNHFERGSIYWTPDTGAHEVHGLIRERWAALAWEKGVLGYPVADEAPTPDGKGRFGVFQHGSVYWTPDTGAHAVWGVIRDAWAALGWEAGLLGYPIANERTTPDGAGRYVVFQGGSIYWSPATGAHEVHGAIRDRWKQEGWEAGALGYPITDEYGVVGGRRSDFEHGSIVWTAATNTTEVIMN